MRRRVRAQRRRRRIIALAVVALALAGGGSGYWYVAAAEIRQGLAEWAAARRADGMRADYARVAVTGFPFHLRAVVLSPVLARPVFAEGGRDAGPAWEWRGSEVVAGVLPWDRRRVDLWFPGTHQVTLPLRDGGWAVFATAGRAAGDLEIDGRGAPRRGRLAVDDLNVAAGDGSDVVTVSRASLLALAPGGEAASHGESSLDLVLRGEGVELPAEPDPPLGRHIARVDAEASLMGRVPPGTLREAAIQWRDGGGTLEVHRLFIEWGPLEIEAGGTMALDESLQPIGAMTAVIRGFTQTVDALVGADMVAPTNGATAKLVLQALSKRPEDGGPAEITVPVTVQNGKLYVGPVALLRVPRVRWE